MVATKDRASRPAIGKASQPIPHREGSRVLSPWMLLGRYGQPGEIEKAIQKHWTANGAASRLEDAAASVKPQVVCPLDEGDEPTELQERFETECQRTIDECVTNWHLDTPGDFSDVMRQMTRGNFFGFAAFEKRWVPDPSANRGVRLELALIHWSSLQSIRLDLKTGRIETVRQWLEGIIGETPISGDDIVWIAFGDWPTGNPKVRALLALIELAAELLKSGITAAQHDSGFVTIDTSGIKDLRGDSAEAARRRRRLADTIHKQTGLPCYVEQAEITVHYAGEGLDREGLLKYIDDRINSLLDQIADSLGATAGNGTRALGEAQGDADAQRQSRTFNSMLQKLGQALFPWFAECWKYNRKKLRMPMLQAAKAEMRRDPVKSAELLASAMTSGVLDWPLEFATYHMRENLGLPEDVISAWAERKRAQEEAVKSASQDDTDAPAVAQYGSLNGAQITAALGLIVQFETQAITAAQARELLLNLGIPAASVASMLANPGGAAESLQKLQPSSAPTGPDPIAEQARAIAEQFALHEPAKLVDPKWRPEGDGSSVGLFLPVPASVDVQLPERPGDPSPSHITLLYVGDVRGREQEFSDIVFGMFEGREPGVIDIVAADVDHFQNHKGQSIAHLVPRFSTDPRPMRQELIRRLEASGFEVEDKGKDEWKPHLTLAYYDDPNEHWAHEVPSLAWQASEIEIWGLPAFQRITLVPQRSAKFAEHDHHPLCGCLSERRGVTLYDYDGNEFTAARPFIGRFEEVVSWADNERQRMALDAQARASLEDVQRRHVEALRSLLSQETPGLDQGARRAELDRIRQSYGTQYASVLTQHAESITQAVRNQAAEERERQIAMNVVGDAVAGASPNVLRGIANEAQGRITEQAQDEGEELARATQHEMVSYWRGGGDVQAFTPRRVTTGVLDRSVAAVGNASESMGRVTEASRAALDPSMVLHSVSRSALMDGCEVCTGPERDGMTWDLTTQEGVEAFRSSRARLVPDPACKGTEKRCRCSLHPQFGPRL